MTRMERDWQQDEADRLQPTDRLSKLLSALSPVPAHDSAGLTQRVMQAVKNEPAWTLSVSSIKHELDSESLVPFTSAIVPPVPVHDSAVLQAAIRDKLGTPEERVEYLACGLAAGFLDAEEANAAAHRLAGDPVAREVFARHEKLESMLAEWSQAADSAVASADLSRLHKAIAAETAPAPAVIPFPRSYAAPALGRSSSRTRPLLGWLLGGLSMAAAVAGVWVGLRWQSQTVVAPNVTQGVVVAQAHTPQPAGKIGDLLAESDLAFAGPTLAPPLLDTGAVLMVAVAPAQKADGRLPADSTLLPADDADARPRGSVTVAVDVPARNSADENAMLYF